MPLTLQPPYCGRLYACKGLFSMLLNVSSDFFFDFHGDCSRDYHGDPLYDHDDLPISRHGDRYVVPDSVEHIPGYTSYPAQNRLVRHKRYTYNNIYANF
jgi:hypothetical protein